MSLVYVGLMYLFLSSLTFFLSFLPSSRIHLATITNSLTVGDLVCLCQWSSLLPFFPPCLRFARARSSHPLQLMQSFLLSSFSSPHHGLIMIFTPATPSPFFLPPSGALLLLQPPLAAPSAGRRKGRERNRVESEGEQEILPVKS